MGEGVLGLPTDGAGKQLRVELGDGTTNLIPSGVYEEVLIVSDAQGLIPGDTRQRATNVAVVNETLLLVLQELREIKFLLS